MTRMKKTIALLLALLMLSVCTAFALTSCGGNDESGAGESSAEESKEPTKTEQLKAALESGKLYLLPLRESFSGILPESAPAAYTEEELIRFTTFSVIGMDMLQQGEMSVKESTVVAEGKESADLTLTVLGETIAFSGQSDGSAVYFLFKDLMEKPCRVATDSAGVGFDFEKAADELKSLLKDGLEDRLTITEPETGKKVYAVRYDNERVRKILSFVKDEIEKLKESYDFLYLDLPLPDADDSVSLEFSLNTENDLPVSAKIEACENEEVEYRIDFTVGKTDKVTTLKLTVSEDGDSESGLQEVASVTVTMTETENGCRIETEAVSDGESAGKITMELKKESDKKVSFSGEMPVSVKSGSVSLYLPLIFTGSVSAAENGYDVKATVGGEMTGMLNVVCEIDNSVRYEQKEVAIPTDYTEQADADAILAKLEETCPTIYSVLESLLEALEPQGEDVYYMSDDYGVALTLNTSGYVSGLEFDTLTYKTGDSALTLLLDGKEFMKIPFTKSSEETATVYGEEFTLMQAEEIFRVWSSSDVTLYLFPDTDTEGEASLVFSMPEAKDGFISKTFPDGHTEKWSYSVSEDGTTAEVNGVQLRPAGKEEDA